tara:strand:- start:508 stop:1317 length:810 start_codon:yes stop_codon:yes gene_type:complete
MSIYHLSDDNVCTLPIGIYRDGIYHKEVIIDELTGVDQHALSDPKNRKNPQGAISNILRRVIQEIPGVLDKKSNPTHLIPERYINEMFQADIDALVLKCFIVSEESSRTLDFDCAACEAKLQEDLDLKELDVYGHDPEEPPFVNIELPRGIEFDDTLYKKGRFHFITGGIQNKISKYANRGLYYTFSAVMTQCLELEDGQKFNLEQVARMKAKDRNYVMSVVQDTIPGVDLNIEIECPECGADSEVAVDVANFFLPNRRKSKRSKKRSV